LITAETVSPTLSFISSALRLVITLLDHVVAYAHDNMRHDATELNLRHFPDQPIPRRQGHNMFSL
jgi:hypothetical protein